MLPSGSGPSLRKGIFQKCQKLKKAAILRECLCARFYRRGKRSTARGNEAQLEMARRREWKMRFELGIDKPTVFDKDFGASKHRRYRYGSKGNPVLWAHSRQKVPILYSYPRTISEARYFIESMLRIPDDWQQPADTRTENDDDTANAQFDSTQNESETEKQYDSEIKSEGSKHMADPFFDWEFDEPMESSKEQSDTSALPISSTRKNAKSVIENESAEQCPVKCVVFTESNCPFSQNALAFLNTLGIDYVNVELDAFANKQLLQNELEVVCGEWRGRMAPVTLIRRGDDCMSVASAQTLGQAWISGSLHHFYPHIVAADNSHQKYADGTWLLEDWRRATQSLALLRESFGYLKTTPSNYSEPLPNVIHKWRKLMQMPVFSNEMGNPLRPRLSTKIPRHLRRK